SSATDLTRAGPGTRIALLSGRSLVGSRPALGVSPRSARSGPADPFPLADSSSVERVPVGRHIIHAERHEVATTQLAVDRKIEHGQVARAGLQLQLGPDRPHVPGRNGGFGPVSLPLFQAGRLGLAICDEGLLSFMVGLPFER